MKSGEFHKHSKKYWTYLLLSGKWPSQIIYRSQIYFHYFLWLWVVCNTAALWNLLCGVCNMVVPACYKSYMVEVFQVRPIWMGLAQLNLFKETNYEALDTYSRGRRSFGRGNTNACTGIKSIYSVLEHFNPEVLFYLMSFYWHGFEFSFVKELW